MNKQAPQQQMLKTIDVARALDITRSTVIRLIQAGEIPGRRIGSSYRVPRRWLDEQFAGLEAEA